MARVGEFCAANVAKLVLSVVIAVAVAIAAGVWLFYSPGHPPVINQTPPHKIAVPK